jgi:nicotinate dehydrogenase subunit A
MYANPVRRRRRMFFPLCDHFASPAMHSSPCAARQRIDGGNMPSIELNVNGATRAVEVRDPGQPLLFVLRNDLGLTGAKFGCGLGQCGACTVIVDGAATRACAVPVSSVRGKKITTIESLGTPDKPHPVQAAFIAEQAAQCGYCTTGVVMSAVALFGRKPDPTLEDAKAALAGNLCKCGSHQRVLNAMMRVAGRAKA